MKLPDKKISTQLKQKRNNGSLRVATINNDPSMTQQQFKDECDINNIIKKYSSTGQITHLARSQGVYADLSKIQDYQHSLNQVLEAEQAFGTLPAVIRERFQNNPAELVKFVSNPKNLEEGIKLGLFERKNPPKPNDLNEPKTPPTEPPTDPKT